MEIRVALHGFLVGLALASTGFVADPAMAVTCNEHATITGTVDVTGRVPLSSACDVSYNTVDSARVVNSESMFSFSDWQFLSRDNTDPTLGTPDEIAVSISMLITGNAYSGTLSLASNIWSRYSHLFLVLKAGGQNSNITGFVSYLLSPGTFSWTYATPYLNSGGGGGGGKKGSTTTTTAGAPQEISHFSVYGRRLISPPPAPVPVPAGGLLLVSSLAGLAFLRGRRQAA